MRRMRNNRSIGGIVTAIFAAIAVLFAGGVIATIPQTANAADGTLAIAQYVTQSGSVQCAADQKSSTYNGTVTMDVPIATVMSAYESDMKNAADNGWYPHGKDGKNKIAYIEYSLTFPEAVTLGNISMASASAMFPNSGLSYSTSGNVVTFKLKLIDQNWAGVYKAYQSDMTDSNNHKITISVPYSVTATSQTDAAKYDSESITGSGNFEFHTSGNWYAFTKRVYSSDTATLNFADGMVDCFPKPEVKKTTKWVDESGAELKASVTGTDFAEQGTIDGYEYVSSSVSSDGNTKTYVFKEVSKSTTGSTNIEADLLGSVDGSTRSTATSPLKASSKDSSFDVTGALHVGDSVSKQMEKVSDNFNQNSSTWSNIKLSNVQFKFTSTLTLPEGLKFGTMNQTASFEGPSGFKVDSTTINGQTATVTLTLADANSITTFKQLKDTVDAIKNYTSTVKGAQQGTLYTTIKDIRFADNAAADTNYTIVGTTSGTFSGTATIADATTSHDFLFDWTSSQQAAGSDSVNPQSIALSVQYVSPASTNLDADIVTGSNHETEHNEIYFVKGKNSTFTLSGVVGSKTVKDQMAAIEKQYNKTGSDFPKIDLSAVRFGFTATLTLPSGMTFNDVKTSDITLDGASNFMIDPDQTSFNGQTVTVHFVLKDASSITTYEDLSKAIQALDDNLYVNVPQIGFADSATARNAYTVTGTVTGTFSATAEMNGNVIPFSFVWNGVQTANGADAIAPDDTSKITFTAGYYEAEQTNLPADIAVKTGTTYETEHTQVYEADSKDSTLTLSGVLHVSDAIKKQMKAIETQYSQSSASFENIALSSVDYGFTATLTLPEGMAFTNTNVKDIALVGAPGFVIDSTRTSFDGQTVTVHFSLKDPTSVTNYKILSDIIAGLDDDLRVNVPGVGFTSSSTANTNYTVTGTVSGTFSAKATLGTHTIPFAFEWTGHQKDDESDAVNPDGINFTVRYKAAATPVKPVNPVTPTTPAAPKQPVKTQAESNKAKLAKTGANIAAIMLAMVLMLAAGAGLAISRKKRA